MYSVKNMEKGQSAPINVKTDEEVVKENEDTKEKKRIRNRDYQRAWRQRQKALKKVVSKEEKEEKKRKRHRENQRAYYHRKKASTMAESQNSMPYPVAIIVNVDVHDRDCSQISPSIATPNNMRVNISAEHSGNYRAQKENETQVASDHPSILNGYPKTAAERMREYRARNRKETSIVNHRKHRKSDVERAEEYRALQKANNQSAGIHNVTRIPGDGILEESSSKPVTPQQNSNINNEKLFLENSDSILQQKNTKNVAQLIIGKPPIPKEEMVYLEQEMVCPKQERIYPELDIVYPKHEMVYPEQEMICPKQESVYSEHEIVYPKHEMIYPEQEMICTKQEKVYSEQEIVYPRQEMIYPEQEIVYPEQEMVYPKQEMVYPEQEYVYTRQEMAYAAHGTVYPREEMVCLKQEIVCPKQENPSDAVTSDDWGNNCTHLVKIENTDDSYTIDIPTFS